MECDVQEYLCSRINDLGHRLCDSTNFLESLIDSAKNSGQLDMLTLDSLRSHYRFLIELDTLASLYNHFSSSSVDANLLKDRVGILLRIAEGGIRSVFSKAAYL